MGQDGGDTALSSPLVRQMTVFPAVEKKREGDEETSEHGLVSLTG